MCIDVLHTRAHTAMPAFSAFLLPNQYEYLFMGQRSRRRLCGPYYKSLARLQLSIRCGWRAPGRNVFVNCNLA